MFNGSNITICIPTERASLLFYRLKTWQHGVEDNLITEHCLTNLHRRLCNSWLAPPILETLLCPWLKGTAAALQQLAFLPITFQFSLLPALHTNDNVPYNSIIVLLSTNLNYSHQSNTTKAPACSQL